MEQSMRIIDQVTDELGLDAYHIYPDSRRLIPDAVLWAVASACVIEFLKSFLDLKTLGEQARKQLLELTRRWRERDDLEGYLKTEGLDASVRLALEAARPRLTETEENEAVRALEGSLVQFGIDKHAAHEHAARIARIVLSENPDRK